MLRGELFEWSHLAEMHLLSACDRNLLAFPWQPICTTHHPPTRFNELRAHTLMETDGFKDLHILCGESAALCFGISWNIIIVPSEFSPLSL